MEALIEGAKHLGRCPRYSRLFKAGHQVVSESQIEFLEFRPWGLANLLLPEFRKCLRWPKDI
jgi:hypothetical protein